MRIVIEITNKQAKHLASPHTFHDECEPACEVLKEVQKNIDKRLNLKNLMIKKMKGGRK